MEKLDVSTKEPRLKRDLLARLESWRRKVGAQMPTVNANYDAEKNK